MADARQYLTVDGDFDMVRGTLASPVIAYETWGRLNDRAGNAILVFTGLSPSAHATSSRTDPSTGWWEDMVGPSKPIDSRRYFIICINSLGSCFGSTGPASENPNTGEIYKLDFPVLSLEDIARAGQLVTASLGIKRLHAVVGSSMGGMTALAFTLLFPGQAEGLLSISAALRSLPFSIALRSLQRELIRKDPAWRDGNYAIASPPEGGMRLARKLGMITYRSAEEWAERFGRERATNNITSGNAGPFGIDFEVESYLQSHAEKFVGSFDANCYLYLSRAMDLFDASDHGGSIGAALARTSLSRALVVGVRTDFLFPPQQQRELADGLIAAGVDVDFQILDSIQGHDSFLIDMDRFRPVVGQFFQGVPHPSASQ
jgi:homoserine O-acetyltransferase